MAETCKKGEPYRIIRCCVDSYEDNTVAGRFFSQSFDEGAVEFRSMVDFLLKVENIFDEAQFPQSYTAKRSFAPLPELTLLGEDGQTKHTGEKATFLIRVMFRQHASWQGTVTWVEGKGEQHFRSVLELILLMDSALASS